MSTTPSNPVQSCQPITDTLCMLGNLPLQYADGPDYCTVTDVTGGAFALTVQPDLMKLLEAHASAHTSLTARVEGLEAWQRARLETGDMDRKRIWELEAALKDTLNMLRAAHMQLGMQHDSNKRVIKARAVLDPKGAAV